MATIETDTPKGSEPDPAPELIGLIDEIVTQLDAGQAVRPGDYEATHPALAPEIARLLPALEALAALRVQYGSGSGSGPVSSPGAIEPLGGTLLDDFQLVRVIGRGAMGIVYEAVERVLGRRVALKVLPAAVALDERARLRFQIGAQATALLQHPHIVPIYTIGEAQGVPYVVMPLIDGCNLAELVEALKALQRVDYVPQAVSDVPPVILELALELLVGAPGSQDGWATAVGQSVGSSSERGRGFEPRSPGLAGERVGRWPPLELGRPYARAVARLGLQAAQALQHAHQQGIVHRDIKPANLLLDRGAQLRITDFGLARLSASQGLTRTGDLVGTIPYMSPEQTQGRSDPLDHRSDVYSLGATLYELLTLQVAMAGTDRAEVLRRIAHEEPTPLPRLNPAVPADLATIVARAMAKQPLDRYATAGELADDLARFLDGRPILARPLGRLARGYRWARRNPSLAALTALTLILLSTLAAGAIIVALGQRTQRRDADRLRTLAERRAIEADQSAREAQRAHERAHQDLQRAIFAYRDLALRLDDLGHSPAPEVLRVRDDSFREAARWCEEHLARIGAPERWTEVDLVVAGLLGPLRVRLGQFEDAVAIGQVVREVGTRLRRADPQNPGLMQLQAGALINLMNAQSAAGQVEAAAATGVEADRVLAASLARHPHDVATLRIRFGLLGNQAAILQRLGRPGEALAVDRASLPLLETVERLGAATRADRMALAVREGRAGFGLLEQGRPAEALPYLDRALDRFGRLDPGDPPSDPIRLQRRMGLEWRGRAYSRIGRHAEAATDVLALVRLESDPGARWHLRLWAAQEAILAGQIAGALASLDQLAVDPDAVPRSPLGLAQLCATILAAPAATPAERDRAAALARNWLDATHRQGLLVVPEHRDPLRRAVEFQPLRDRPELRPIFDLLATTPAAP